MNPSKLLKHFLRTGEKPSSQRDASALLDESRSILASRLPTTGETIQMFSDGDIDSILAGGKSGVMERAYAIYSQKEGRFVKTGTPLAATPPAPRPAAKAPRPAPAATKPAVVNRATATKPSAPAPSAPSPKLTTAAEFAEPVRLMLRSEWDLLSAADKNRWMKSGGKITNQ